MSTIHQFDHNAMKTTFILRIVSDEAKLAHDVAHAAITLIDEIEQTLSRYIEGSDVFRINHMESGQTLFISETCYDCLRLAAEANAQTGGLFDITLGTVIEHQKNASTADVPELKGSLSIDPDRPALTCIEAGREIDLGGIGKGYALDQIKILLDDWGIESALLSAGASTQLAFGPKSWSIELGSEHAQPTTIELNNQALSASGTAIQGSHIVSPLQHSEPDYAFTRAWILQENAALADAWSTALMLIDREQLDTFEAPENTLYFETSTGIHSLQQLQANKFGND